MTGKPGPDGLNEEGHTETGAARLPRPAPVAAGPSPIWIAALAVVAVAAGTAGWLLGGGDSADRVSDGAVTSFVLVDNYTTSRSPVIGPDGSIVFYDPEGSGGLVLRAAGSLEAVPLAGANVSAPASDNAAFSPDARWLVFVEDDGSGGKLRRIPAEGGSVNTLWTGEGRSGARSTPEWSDDGWIYVDIEGALARVPEEGGPADILMRTASRVNRIESLPGGRGIAITLSSRPEEAHVVLMDLATGDTTTLVADGFDARYVNSGHMIYAHANGALHAMPFDARRLETTGPAVPVIDDLAVAGVHGRYDVSPDGTLVYAQGAGSGPAAVRLIVVNNWLTALKQRIGEGT